MLRPIFIQLLQGKTDEIAATMKVPNLVGDFMDMDVPMHKIEKVRREMVQSGELENLLWLSVLVCAAYQDNTAYKEEIVDLMEKDLESQGLSKDAEKLTQLCRYTFSQNTFYNIIQNLLDRNISHFVSDALFKEFEKNFENYKITKALTITGKYKVMLELIKYIVLVMTGFVISLLILYFHSLLPQSVSWLLLFIMITTIVSTLFILWNIIQKQPIPRSWEDIKSDILSDTPDFRIRTP